MSESQEKQKPTFKSWREKAVYLEKQKKELEDQLEVSKNFKQKYLDKNSEFVAQNLMIEEIENDREGWIKKVNINLQTLLLSNLYSLLAIENDIKAAIKSEKPSNRAIRITQEVVILVLGGLFLWQISTNKSFSSAIFSNLLPIGVIIVAVVATIVYFRNYRMS